jgi:hypothetical protein
MKDVMFDANTVRALATVATVCEFNLVWRSIRV